MSHLETSHCFQFRGEELIRSYPEAQRKWSKVGIASVFDDAYRNKGFRGYRPLTRYERFLRWAIRIRYRMIGYDAYSDLDLSREVR